MKNNIENLIEQLTKVRPEMLNEEALKLFNTIMAVLDERDKLKKENQELINELQDKDDEIRFANRDIKVFETEFIQKTRIKEIRDKAEVMDYYMLNDVIDDLNKLLGDEENE